MEDSQIALIAGMDSLSKEQKGTIVSCLAGRKSWEKRNIGHVTKSILGRYPNIDVVNKNTRTEWAMGYFFVVRRSLLEKWKLVWDEKLTGYAYAEDLDFTVAYCEKALEKGYKCILTPKVIVRHMVSREYRIEKKEHVYKYIINREYIYYKHYRKQFSRFWMIWSNYLMLLQRILKNDNVKLYINALVYVKKIESI